MYLIFSTSLHPESRSRILANQAICDLTNAGESCELIDLACLKPLPLCNGHDCYDDPTVMELADKITAATGILLAAPVYNFDVSASCKNLIELTGSAWTDKVVGMICAAGGASSYMAPMSLFNSLMLDFRCLVLPKFVYAQETSFANGSLVDGDIQERIHALVEQLRTVASAIRSSG